MLTSGFRVRHVARRLFSCSSTVTASESALRSRSSDTLASARGRVPASIWAKTSAQLHLRRNHPLNTLRKHIEAYIHEKYPSTFRMHSSLPPVVSTVQCFDDLRVPRGHVSRAPTDTYYVDDTTLLRTHMTAHDVELLAAGETAFLLCGDVYRRDTVDRTHYPVFHQVDAARLFPSGTSRKQVEEDLKQTLSGLAKALFGDVEMRWVEGYFPFTHPSFELEVAWQGEWLEVLGCGLLHREVLQRGGVSDDVEGWAFGMGLERLAMVLFGIPDIRLFWSEDERFLGQFNGKGIEARYKPFSVFPAVEKDVSFWVEDISRFHENDIHELAREVCGDLVENVKVVDTFKKGGRLSLCFRITFRSMEKTLTHAEVNKLYNEFRTQISETLPVTIR